MGRKQSTDYTRPGEHLPEPNASTGGDAPKALFTLSDEFIFLFRECDSSDVLELLKENWHHYSQWIDGAQLKWQSIAFVNSTIRLKNSLGACVVQSANGLLPLRETVLPTLDVQLDGAESIPSLKIKNPQSPAWNLLSYFGVILKTDIHYYLRCLISMSEQACSDIDTVAYLYDQIQSRYSKSEDLIR
jgi:hypothetical protein